MDRLVSIINMKIKHQVLECNLKALYDFTNECYGLKLYSELENLARFLVDRHPLGKAILARSLFALCKIN